MQSLSRWCACLAVAALAAVALAEPALAEAAGQGAAGHAADAAAHGADHGSGGLPQLNPASYASQVFWLAITFGLLFWLMSKVALPRVAEVLEARQEKITNDLEKATALKTEAEGVMQAYDKALADARASAQKLMAETVSATDAETARRNAELGADLAQRTRAAEERILAAKQTALDNVRGVAAEAAQAAVERLVGVAPSADDAGAAVDSVMRGAA
ncbi:F0F1 ATP synthase subunit B family protein [Aerophototrophica crusticola]|uniref:F0F1 ATP synthase subunit B family protein n=1 Tax=Aerophototrophica crusticola TaxID=1709002 RepID=UPI00384EEB71